MRPATRLAIVAAVAVVLAVLVFAVDRDDAPIRPPSRQARPPELTPASTPAVASEAERQRVLDELEDKEADQFGHAEAARRRRQREQLLDQRPGASD